MDNESSHEEAKAQEKPERRRNICLKRTSTCPRHGAADPSFEHYKGVHKMHYTARLYKEFHRELWASYPDFSSRENLDTVAGFLVESKGVELPNFLPSLVLVVASKMEEICFQVVTSAHDYVQDTAANLVLSHTSGLGWPSFSVLYGEKVEIVFGRCLAKCEEFVKRKLRKEKNYLSLEPPM
ncbi:hypothetical protein SELMODRAFT_430095 [Selaginella moellendorffii]|uniref:Dynamin stalk domain-containing protein n=1 Tax=Selaginella moellendorffii TaxID=88036 RepID=D8T8B2_SELML|nr:hypothetical protein SELMODRAFT_430095 [Selaginella moellendorffii]